MVKKKDKDSSDNDETIKTQKIETLLSVDEWGHKKKHGVYTSAMVAGYKKGLITEKEYDETLEMIKNTKFKG